MEQGIWTREFLISPELCGMDGRLGVLGGLTLFQALAMRYEFSLQEIAELSTAKTEEAL